MRALAFSTRRQQCDYILGTGPSGVGGVDASDGFDKATSRDGDLAHEVSSGDIDCDDDDDVNIA